MLTKGFTNRGFRILEFNDRNGYRCNIQESSVADENCIWIGLESASPKALHLDATKLGFEHDKKCGWVSVDIPNEISLNTRMHISTDQAKFLGDILLEFAKTGELIKDKS